MSYPCRCNKRTCQARKSLKKHPADYKHRPECPIHGCGGLMYLDEYRYSGGAKDQGSAEVCRLDCLPHVHRTSTEGCRSHEDYLRKRNAAPRSKHSPIPKDGWVPF